MKPVIILGGGGHAGVMLSILRRLRVSVIGIVDPHLLPHSQWRDVTVLGGDAAVLDYASEQIELVNGIGSLPHDDGLRAGIFERFKREGYIFKTLVDPQAWIAAEVDLAEGVQLLAGSLVQSGTKIAENSIINSGAIVEHDCRIGKHVHIATGAVLCGQVEIDDRAHIGAGATLIQCVKIGEASVVGAGSVVTRELGKRKIVYPARSHVQDLD